MNVDEFIELKLVHRTKLFMSHVDIVDGHWLWTATLKPDGYGRFNDGNRHWQAHGWSYTRFVGPIPVGLELGHIPECRYKNCVNYEHVRPVTHLQNMRDGTDTRIDTHCPHGHEFTEENLYVRKNGQAHCRECQRIRTAQWRRNKKLGLR